MGHTTIADGMKKVAVALGYGSSVNEYVGDNIADVLRQIAVKMECAASTGVIASDDIGDILDYIAENYGEETKEPYDLTVTKTHATVTIKRGGKTISAGKDVLRNGDKITITATADEGYTLTTLTANGDSIDSGDIITIDGEGVTIVATGTSAG